PHARADGAALQSMSIQFTAHDGRIDVRGVFHRNLHRLKTPLLESLEQTRALGGERGREQKSVDANSHKECGVRLEEQNRVSSRRRGPFIAERPPPPAWARPNGPGAGSEATSGGRPAARSCRTTDPDPEPNAPR